MRVSLSSGLHFGSLAAHRGSIALWDCPVLFLLLLVLFFCFCLCLYYLSVPLLLSIASCT